MSSSDLDAVKGKKQYKPCKKNTKPTSNTKTESEPVKFVPKSIILKIRQF